MAFADDDAFLAAVCSNPDADAPRLVYADYLDEGGDPVWQARAAFIRIGCAAPIEIVPTGRPPGNPLDPLGKGLSPPQSMIDQQVELYRRCVRKWNGPLHQRLHRSLLPGQVRSRGGIIRRWSYRRGFLYGLWATPTALVDYPDELLALGPIERLTLVGTADHGVFTAALAAMARFRFRELAVAARIAAALRSALDRRRFPWMARLTSLTLSGERLV
jgi:uncharacterized protein (TIGR02996 family)